MPQREITRCDRCGLRFEILPPPFKHECPPSVQPCQACGGQYGRDHVCLPPEGDEE